MVVAPAGHPRARYDGTILEHRLVMERELGRFLEEWEIVLHKDGDRSNNSLQNLELLDGRAGRGEQGHPPAHSFDLAGCIQVLLQQEDLPSELRDALVEYRSR